MAVGQCCYFGGNWLMVGSESSMAANTRLRSLEDLYDMPLAGGQQVLLCPTFTGLRKTTFC